MIPSTLVLLNLLAVAAKSVSWPGLSYHSIRGEYLKKKSVTGINGYDNDRNLADNNDYFQDIPIYSYTMVTKISIQIPFINTLIRNEDIDDIEKICLVFLLDHDQNVPTYGKIISVEIISQEMLPSYETSTIVIDDPVEDFVLGLKFLVRSKITVRDMNSIFKFGDAIKGAYVNNFTALLESFRYYWLGARNHTIESIHSLSPFPSRSPSFPPTEANIDTMSLNTSEPTENYDIVSKLTPAPSSIPLTDSRPPTQEIKFSNEFSNIVDSFDNIRYRENFFFEKKNKGSTKDYPEASSEGALPMFLYGLIGLFVTFLVIVLIYKSTSPALHPVGYTGDSKTRTSSSSGTQAFNSNKAIAKARLDKNKCIMPVSSVDKKVSISASTKSDKITCAKPSLRQEKHIKRSFSKGHQVKNNEKMVRTNSSNKKPIISRKKCIPNITYTYKKPDSKRHEEIVHLPTRKGKSRSYSKTSRNFSSHPVVSTTFDKEHHDGHNPKVVNVLPNKSTREVSSEENSEEKSTCIDDNSIKKNPELRENKESLPSSPSIRKFSEEQNSHTISPKDDTTEVSQTLSDNLETLTKEHRKKDCVSRNYCKYNNSTSMTTDFTAESCYTSMYDDFSSEGVKNRGPNELEASLDSTVSNYSDYSKNSSLIEEEREETIELLKTKVNRLKPHPSRSRCFSKLNDSIDSSFLVHQEEGLIAVIEEMDSVRGNILQELGTPRNRRQNNDNDLFGKRVEVKLESEIMDDSMTMSDFMVTGMKDIAEDVQGVANTVSNIAMTTVDSFFPEGFSNCTKFESGIDDSSFSSK